MPIPPQAEIRPHRVILNRPIADGCFALVLEPVDPAAPVPDFKAGQWVGLHLMNPDGSEWARAAYSIAIAPSERSQGRIELGIKREGEFTGRAQALKPGDVVKLQGPFGMFTPGADAERYVFLAGGIGIVPIRSMIRELASSSVPKEMFLLYSSRDVTAMPYLEEFRSLASSQPNFTFVEFCTGDCPEDWNGEHGRIDEVRLRRVLGSALNGEFLMCGPNAFMDDLTAVLKGMNVDPKRIRKERFS